MAQVFELVKKAARSEANILVLGESGTGKELIARAVHANSPRAPHAFIPVDCAALPENLLESELFGHEKGSSASCRPPTATSATPSSRATPTPWPRWRAYRWPGNVRELQNVIERACALADGGTITRADLPEHVHTGGRPVAERHDRLVSKHGVR